MLHEQFRVAASEPAPSSSGKPHAALRTPSLCQFLACVHQFTASDAPAFVQLSERLVCYIATHSYIVATMGLPLDMKGVLAQVRFCETIVPHSPPFTGVVAVVRLQYTTSCRDFLSISHGDALADRATEEDRKMATKLHTYTYSDVAGSEAAPTAYLTIPGLEVRVRCHCVQRMVWR